ncbi:MAG TPA: glycoside hydrolase family 68 protein [Acidimicrobiia bacterium]
MTISWTREQVGLIVDDPATCTPVLTAAETGRMIPDLYLWDLWPVRLSDGAVALVDGREIWMALSAPSRLDPGQRHDAARIRIISWGGGGWVDHGPLFPEGASLGSREWAGCATFDPESGALEVCYTASGRRGESAPTFVQRIVRTVGGLRSGEVRAQDWEPHVEAVTAGGRYRSTAEQDTGEPGFIKAFRDPFRFDDPAGSGRYLLFTASLVDSKTEFDGAIGIAREGEAGYRLLPPLIEADGVNNELERPHLVVRDGAYYLFFSTQARTFHPDVAGPTGLYGFVGDSLSGPWQPLNGSALVLRNPFQEPFQAYSWLVLPNLEVASFIDFHSLRGRRPEDVEGAGQGRAHFGGTLAPIEKISLDGATASLQPRR